MVTSNVFDPISDQLDQRVFNGDTPKPTIVRFIKKLYDRVFYKTFGVHNDGYVHLYLTGSLTTYQYGPSSDCDISAFPNYPKLFKLTGEDAGVLRKKLIKMNIEHLDGTFLPGGSHPIQVFALPDGALPQDRFAKGVRSGWDFQTKEWLVPPEKDRVHVIEREFPEVYARAAGIADKMTEMLDAHDYKAADTLWEQVHRKRQLDQQHGGGDFSEGNIVYKFLVHEGIVDRLRNELGLQIETKTAAMWDAEWYADLVKQYGEQAMQIIHRFDSIWPSSVAMNLEYEDSPEEQVDFVVSDGCQWKFAISNGKAHAWGDGEVMSLNDGFHPHTYVMYDDLNVSDITPSQAVGWITKPPLKEGDEPYVVEVNGGKAYSDDEILKMLTLAPGEGKVERTGRPALLGSVKPITMKIIYDPELDHIVLGTQADATGGKHIIGEYHGDEVTLHPNPHSFLNANYFRRLWAFSFPHRPLNKVHVHDGISGQKIELPTLKPRHAATQTGDPRIDALLDSFLTREVEHVSGLIDIDSLRDPETAKGLCFYLATAFGKYAEENGIETWLPNREGRLADNFYADRDIKGYDAHYWTYVKSNTGDVFGIDWTAAQYGYKEFPMVQRLQDDRWIR